MHLLITHGEHLVPKVVAAKRGHQIFFWTVQWNHFWRACENDGVKHWIKMKNFICILLWAGILMPKSQVVLAQVWFGRNPWFYLINMYVSNYISIYTYIFSRRFSCKIKYYNSAMEKKIFLQFSLEKEFDLGPNNFLLWW